uniref:Retrovirus-related Pol polyprotein from transposon TNT 1-94-like beta-barrel domain-containing protein n=1 Tax=Manihot esculenta TaxID=3983 RepID=A0A2C9VA95_MANES
MLPSLPPSYKNFREILIYSNKSLKVEEVKTSLYSKELFDKEISTSHSNGQAKDSTCSFHICLHKEWFSSYELVDKGVVLMGNDHHYKVFGIGTIKIRMYDGMIRTLIDVWYVPDMKKKLISLHVLDNLDC